MKASGAIRFFLCAAVDYLLFFALLPMRLALLHILLPISRATERRMSEKRRKKAKKILAFEIRMVYNMYVR